MLPVPEKFAVVRQLQQHEQRLRYHASDHSTSSRIIHHRVEVFEKFKLLSDSAEL